MNRSDFLRHAHMLISVNVEGVSCSEKHAILQRICDRLAQQGESALPQLSVVPFVRGRRPWDEIRYAGYGSSEHAGLFLSDGTDAQEPQSRVDSPPNKVYVLYQTHHLESLHGADQEQLSATVSFYLERDDTEDKPTYQAELHAHSQPIDGWQSLPLTPQLMTHRAAPDADAGANSDSAAPPKAALQTTGALYPSNDGASIQLSPCSWTEARGQTLAYSFSPESLLTPAQLSFGQLWHQTVRVELQLKQGDHLLSEESAWVEVYNYHRMGSLYQRIVDRLLIPDTTAQCHAAGIAPLDVSYHPWYPVLCIGAEKAALYMQALHQDIVRKARHLTDPRWLLRVGLYLELLTCIGVFEAVKADVGDLLTSEERDEYERSPLFAPIRKALDVDAWRKVWAMREIVFKKRGFPRTGPVSSANLLTKKKATLAFLQAHHEDLKAAIVLAGPNEHNAQETWHRVFRDAERAVLRKCLAAFPELADLSDRAREFAMWHEKGKFPRVGVGLGTISRWFGDQDGLYASACNQYRDSMNEVAHWAKLRDLMDYTGAECVPTQVSILRAYMTGKDALLQSLQQRDGYAPTIDIDVAMSKAPALRHQQIEECLARLALLQHLTTEERQQLATRIRQIQLGPMERIVVQDQPGSSLFVAFDGALEVLSRQKDGHDLSVATLTPPAVFGELSFLTGAPRSCTVRAIEQATVLEISAAHLKPLIEERPELLDSFAALMAARVKGTAQQTAQYSEQQDSFLQRIRSYLFQH